jgi:hypothetical protein
VHRLSGYVHLRITWPGSPIAASAGTWAFC